MMTTDTAMDFTLQKQRLLEAGIDLFVAKGYTGTSIRDIATAHGTSISNIYHYFGSKEGLLIAILQCLSAKLLEALREIPDSCSDPLEGLKRLVTNHIRLCFENLNGTKIFLLDAEHFSPEGNKVSREIQLKVLEIYVRQLGLLAEAGIIKKRNLKVMAFNILACINWQMRWYRPKGPLTPDEVCQEILSFVLHGVMGADGQEES
jgi:AcrR family transcriptional regulator